jgi:hypothetical protein
MKPRPLQARPGHDAYVAPGHQLVEHGIVSGVLADRGQATDRQKAGGRRSVIARERGGRAAIRLSRASSSATLL